MDNRDTDWFLCYGIGATMTATVRTSSWPVQLFFFYGTSCPYLQGPSATGSCGGNEPTLSRFVANNAYVWIMVAPTIFSGLSCASDYILTMDGIGVGPGNDCVSTGVPERPDEQAPGRQKGSWGTIKRLYR
jgi:hypothetical protein